MDGASSLGIAGLEIASPIEGASDMDVDPSAFAPGHPAWKESTMTSSRLGHRHQIGITRRELLQVGYSALLGVGLPSLLAHRAAAVEPFGTQRG